MHSISPNGKRLRLVMALAACLFCASLAPQETFGQDSGAYPVLSGTYTSSGKHPRVFMTQADLNDLVTRINVPGSFSAKNFSKLTNQIKADLAANVDWDATYTGCDIDTYLHAFSIVQTVGYANQNRSADQLSAVMNVKPGSAPPLGAAVVASRLSRYAALIKAGVHTVQNSPAPNQAGELARRILLTWANRRMRDQNGNILHSAEQFCDAQGKPNRISQNAVGLQIGRGVVYSVDAQDLLQSIGAFNATETMELNAFHAAMFDLIRNASNFRAAMPEMNSPDSTCERYSNHVGAHLMGLLSIARLLDDSRKFNTVLYGNDGSMPLTIPWMAYFNHAIYGQNDRPITCHKNNGPDSLSSHPSFSTNLVAPGEILDRYRNDNPSQGFGYPLGLLAQFFAMADILENAGIDAYGYRGTHHQSIEMATQYYACSANMPD